MTSPLVLACTSLLDVMDHDEREAVAAHLAAYGAAPLPLASDLLRFVGGLFKPDISLSVSDIATAARQREPDVTDKQVYNALGYLTRRRAIRRVGRGRYTAFADPTPNKDTPDA